MAWAGRSIVLITGANQGIGFATVKQLLQSSQHYHVILSARTLSKAADAVGELNTATTILGTVSSLEMDVSNEASIKTAMERVSEDYPRVDVLINNAGVGGWDESSIREKALATYTTNALGALLIRDNFEPLLLKSADPRLIFISSRQGSLGWLVDERNPQAKMKGGAYYRMSKAAMNMLALESHTTLQDQGVKVWAICPGFVHTNHRRDKERRPGTILPEESAKLVQAVVEGKRDNDVGKLVQQNGVWPW